MGGEGKTGWAPEAWGTRAGTWPERLEEKRTDQERQEYAELWALCRLTRVPDDNDFLAITWKIFAYCCWLPTCHSAFLFPAAFDEGPPSSFCDIWSLEEEAIGGNCWVITSYSSPVSRKGRELPHLSREQGRRGTLQLLSTPNLLFKSQEDRLTWVRLSRTWACWLGAFSAPSYTQPACVC